MDTKFAEQHLFGMEILLTPNIWKVVYYILNKISILHCKNTIKPCLPNESSSSSRREKLLGSWLGGGLVWKLADPEDVLEEEGWAPTKGVSVRRSAGRESECWGEVKTCLRGEGVPESRSAKSIKISEEVLSVVPKQMKNMNSHWIAFSGQ